MTFTYIYMYIYLQYVARKLLHPAGDHVATLRGRIAPDMISWELSDARQPYTEHGLVVSSCVICTRISSLCDYVRC